MSDAMCLTETCPVKMKCHRYTRQPARIGRQLYIRFKVLGDERLFTCVGYKE